MNKEKQIITLLLFVLLSVINISNVKAQYWVVGGSLGTTFYSGDVSPIPFPGDFRVGGKFFGKYKIKNHFLWRSNVDVGWYTGSDSHYNKPFHQARNASFENVMINIATGFEYNFLQFRERKRKQDKFTPYLFMQLGAGIFPILNTTTTRADGIYYAVTLPLGIGFKQRINTHLDFGMEFSITKPLWNDNTDSIFRGDETAPDSEQTVYPSWRDNYYFLGFTLSYHIFNINCPQYKSRK